MKINGGNDIQAIHVYYSSQLNDSSLFNSLLYGMEEESVPSFVKKSDISTALEMSYQAALDSSLGVGIGIGDGGDIILHYTKLAKNEPLFQIDRKDTYKQSVLGANAARLVKGIPFKSFDKVNEETEIQQETLTEEDIASIVAIVLKRLKEIS